MRSIQPLLLAMCAAYCTACCLASVARAAPATQPVVDASTLRGKIMAGYQGWFRCPGDASNGGWVHWSRDGKRLLPKSLTFEMWPDLTEYGDAERFPAPGFTYPDGKPASLFSSDNADTVLRHFQWMREYGVDVAFLQHFAVELAGAPGQGHYPSRLRVLRHVQAAASKTGRAWALTYDLTGMPPAKIYDVVSADWKKLVDDKTTADPRYLHEAGKPVVHLFGFYWNHQPNQMSPEIGAKLIAFFKTPGPYQAFVMGGGDWQWRKNADPAFHETFNQLDAFTPWNVGNYGKGSDGAKRASTGYWAEDRKECERRGPMWVPVVYPGFSWDNLQQKPAGSTIIPRRQGKFLWEQFVELAKMKQSTVYIAMFDEVDEGTAIFKTTDAPPTQAHFVGTEGMPSDWCLRVVREAGKMLRGETAVSAEIPIKP